ncbi:FAD-dependent oxidoreductase [Nonomuraea gerenzanensis]|uniref:Monooxygenase, FAD-binding n=1 Tax=Nonomuraea gerenzanensis TaxID=93944 RepID=A0A1M4E499_9ACTN|nr:FAD-dependent oxidoreductase [Nonomuraea gerenzanensis]UBU15866.1 FAD-dependent monooxygenase [Nonomuraea gerenzanensis]SBO93657.1 monooxygenase, FAD-binding [Nonomuraea gerenzanensis]
MRTLICGAGIAGLTLAWHLERAGWQVELVERAAAFRDGGYMIDFYGPGHQVAERMGLLPRLLRDRYPVSELRYVDRHGRPTSRLRLGAELADVVSLLRGDLARAIADDVRAPVTYGTTVDGAEQHADGVTVRLSDGTTREVDLLVGADGARSRVRELAFGEVAPRYLGHQVAAWIVTDAALSRRIGQRYQLRTEPGLMTGAYALRDDRLALLFLRREPSPALPADPADALRRHFGGLGWILPEVLARVPGPGEVYHDLVTQVELERWHHGRIVLLGDACQAVSLFAGHGASMAMAAAWVLADELTGGRAPADELTGGRAPAGELTGGRAPADGLAVSGDPADLAAAAELPDALARYQARMAPVIGDVQRFGRRFIHWMAPSSRWRIHARDLLFRLAAYPGGSRLFVNSLSPGGHHLISPRRP